MEIILGGARKGVALVSKEDFDLVNKYSWYKTPAGYIMGTVNKKIILMHRFIMKPPSGEQVDHINGIKHDNTRENLRSTTSAKNNENQRKRENASSPYFGVRLTNRNKYESAVSHGGKRYYLGAYENEIEAAKIRDIYIVRNNLDHIQLNFPENKDEYVNSTHNFDKSTKKNQYMGVTQKSKKKTKKKTNVKTMFTTTVCINNKKIHIGSSPNELECAVMYDEYIVKHNIPNKTLNFPENYNYDNREIKTLYETIDDNTIKLITNDDPNECIMMDKNDYDLVKYHNCRIRKGYVVVFTTEGHKFLHGLIMNVIQSNIFVDHIDNDPLNNARVNLRLSNHAQNAQNKRKKIGTSSQYIGCFYSKIVCKWGVSLCLNYKLIYNYYDESEEFAARSRDLYIMKNLPDTHFKLNFEWSPEDIVTWTVILEHKTNANPQIRRKQGPNASKYKGCCYNKNTKKWVSGVYLNRKRVFYYYDINEEFTVRARDLYILKNSLQKIIKLNFDWTPSEIETWTMILEFNTGFTKRSFRSKKQNK